MTYPNIFAPQQPDIFGQASQAQPNIFAQSQPNIFAQPAVPDIFAGQRQVNIFGNVQPDIFANAVWPSEPEALQQVLADSEVQLSSGFIPDKRSLQKLTNFSGKTRYWNLGFHRKALSEGDIEYNPSNGTITIHNLPNDLIESLNKEVESDT